MPHGSARFSEDRRAQPMVRDTNDRGAMSANRDANANANADGNAGTRTRTRTVGTRMRGLLGAACSTRHPALMPARQRTAAPATVARVARVPPPILVRAAEPTASSAQSFWPMPSRQRPRLLPELSGKRCTRDGSIARIRVRTILRSIVRMPNHRRRATILRETSAPARHREWLGIRISFAWGVPRGGSGAASHCPLEM
jgi:hypothetical protein